uniref:Uncharacterized protein n=1 Tax=Knipowitschia caucasica TaxID=637954 RepID=A0AAV2MAY5_KNICA
MSRAPHCGPYIIMRRLKKKSQSVDIASQGFSPTLMPSSPLNRTAPPVAKTLVVQENNTTNSQRRNPRVGELKRGYTIVLCRTFDLCVIKSDCSDLSETPEKTLTAVDHYQRHCLSFCRRCRGCGAVLGAEAAVVLVLRESIHSMSLSIMGSKRIAAALLQASQLFSLSLQ